ITDISTGSPNPHDMFQLNFNATVNGTYKLTILPRLSDLAGNLMDQNENGKNGEAADAYAGTFVLTTVNTPPTISAIANQVFPVGEAIPSIIFTVSDKETPAAGLAVGVPVSGIFSSNQTLLPDGNINLTQTPGTGTWTMTLVPN